MKVTVKTEGFREMDAALGEFSKATAKNILKRTGLAAMEPVARDASSRAHRRTGQLQDAVQATEKLGKRQKRLNRNPAIVEVYVGPTGESAKDAPPQGIWEEFGTEDHPPHPFLRPAWDIGVDDVLARVAEGLSAEIDKATARAQRRAMKAKG